MTILAVVLARIAWRALHRPPSLNDGSSGAMEFVGKLTHWLLYALLLLMPVSGYLQSGNGRPVSYLGLFDLPALPRNKGLGEAAQTAHLLGQWGIYALVALHVLATVWHAEVRRDGLLSRMTPAQDDSTRDGLR